MCVCACARACVCIGASGVVGVSVRRDGLGGDVRDECECVWMQVARTVQCAVGRRRIVRVGAPACCG